MEDSDLQLFQNSIRYLHNISTLPEMNNPALKSFICLKRRLMELRKKSFLPLNATKPNIHCQRCFVNYFDGPASYRLKSKLRKYSFAKKLQTKKLKNLPFTRYQKKYLKRNNTFNGNNLVVTCKFCKYETNIKIDRPRKTKKHKTEILNPSLTKRKKKKNKKDRFCGLNQNVVMSVTSFNNTNNNTNDSEVICLDSVEIETPAKLKMKRKKEKPLETSTPKNTLNTSSFISKKKNKAHGKLTEILNNSSKKRNSSSSNLLQFLKGL